MNSSAAYLKITTPSQRPYTFSLPRARITVGRSPDCDLSIPDKLVSSRHAELFWDGDKLRVRDLGSTNGLFVNGVRRLEARLRTRDTIRVGNSLVEVYLEELQQPAAEKFEVQELTDRTQLDPFSIKISLETLGSELAEAPTAGPASEIVRQRLILLYRLGQEANYIEDMAGWLERIACLVRAILGPERFAFVTYVDGAISSLAHGPRIVFARDWAAAGEDDKVHVPPAFLAQVVEEQKAILYQNTELEPRFFRDDAARAARIRQAMAAPLIAQRGVTGVLYLDRTSAEPKFAPDDLHLLGVIANQCAVMLENVRLFGEARRALDELRATQEQLIHAAKLSSLGELVGGIAHEINNPLAGVLGFAQILVEGTDLTPSAREGLKKIIDQGLRVKRIVEKLLFFARRKSGAFEPVDVNQAVATALDLKGYDLRVHKVDVVTELDPARPLISGDRSEIEQVLVNIIHNADQALEGRDDPRIVIRTRRAGEQVEVSIEDNGPGLPDHVREKVFDPFFTTRPVGIGTGLGLSIAYGIVMRHAGSLRAENAPSGGARFVMTIPAVRKDGPERPAPRAIAPGPLPESIASARVLLVDDEEAIRETTASYLTKRGFRVTLAGHGRDALDALRRGDRFDVMLADLRLPGQTGLEVYEQAAAMDPRLEGRAIFITGDTSNPDCARIEERWPGAVLQKPFDFEELAARIQKLIGSG